MAELFDHALERTAIAAIANASLLNVSRARSTLEQNQLDRSDFHLPLHGTIFEAARRLLLNNLPVDRVQVANEVKRLSNGQPEALKAITAILIDDSAIGNAFPGYAKTIRELALRRRAVELLERNKERANDVTSDIDEIISTGAQDWTALTRKQDALRGGDAYLMDLIDELEQIEQGVRQPVIPTGIDMWDEALGGLEPGTATFIGAQAGVGKSALLATILRNLAKSGTRCGVFSLEDLGTWLPRRFLADEAAVPLFVLAKRPLTKAQKERVEEAAPLVHRYLTNLVIDERSMLTAAQIEQAARDMILNRKCEVIVIDHLGKIDYQAGSYHRHDLAIADALSRFIGLAKSYKVPLLIAAHMKAGGSEAKYRKPELNDFAQAMFIGRDARSAVGLYLTENDQEALNVAVLKQTSGGADIGFSLKRLVAAGLISSKNGKLEGLSYDDDERKMMEARGFIQ